MSVHVFQMNYLLSNVPYIPFVGKKIVIIIYVSHVFVMIFKSFDDDDDGDDDDDYIYIYIYVQSYHISYHMNR